MAEKYSMPIYYSKLTYKINQYVKKNKKLVLAEPINKSSREIHIGNNIQTLNDKKYNNRLLSTLIEENDKKHGCIISIIGIETITQCGYTTKRFDNEE